MLEAAYNLTLRLPAFRGKARLDAYLRRRLRPKPYRIFGGLAMELDPEEWTQIELRAAGRLEPVTTALFGRLLKPGDTFVDVGAHVGYHSLCARRLAGEGGRIFAVDPQPYNCHKMLINAELNGFANITVIAAAAGASPSFVSLKQQSRQDKARLTLHGTGVNDQVATFIVPVITLDWLFATYRIGQAALLKIDVEGFELEVLQGAGEASKRTANIVLEVLPDEDPGRVEQIAQLLRRAGFHLFDVAGAAWQPGQACVENNVWARRL